MFQLRRHTPQMGKTCVVDAYIVGALWSYPLPETSLVGNCLLSERRPAGGPGGVYTPRGGPGLSIMMSRRAPIVVPRLPKRVVGCAVVFRE